jgi:4-amino-4-deoxy-L-arabinose transferase-like glycosyltransferase
LATRLLVVLFISIFVQLCAGYLGLFRADSALLDFDEREYWNLSSQMLAGAPMEVGRRTILYPLALAAIRSVVDNIWFVQSVVATLGATAAPILGLLAHKLSKSRSAAMLAGLGLALWPPQIFYGSSLYSETLALPLFLLFLLALPLDRTSQSRSKWWRWALAGLLLGVTAHVRPMYQLFFAVLPFVLLLDSRRWSETLPRFFLILAGFAAIVLPWSVYVSRSLHSITILSANGGETLAGGFNQKLIERGERPLIMPARVTWDGPGKWITSSASGYLTAAEQKLSYTEQDRLLKKRTIAWMRNHPADASYLAFRKLTYMWGIYPVASNGWRQAIFGNVPTLILALLFIIALIRNSSVRRWGSRLYVLPIFVTGIAVISWGSWRFRLPADAGMIGIVAILIASRVRQFSGYSSPVGGTACTPP